MVLHREENFCLRIGRGGGWESFIFNSDDAIFPISFFSCQFHGGELYHNDGNVYYTNCLFERVFFSTQSEDDLSATFDVTLENSLFWCGSRFGLQEYVTVVDCGLLEDNMFDRAGIGPSAGMSNSYNGYVTNFSYLTPFGPGSILLTNSFLDRATRQLLCGNQ